jgi:hypothetical protein
MLIQFCDGKQFMKTEMGTKGTKQYEDVTLNSKQKDVDLYYLLLMLLRKETMVVLMTIEDEV